MLLFAAVQLGGEVFIALPQLIHPSQNPLATTAGVQQALVGAAVPMPRQPSGSKGGIEGWPMTLLLGVSQGAIHVPEQGLQAGHHAVELREP